MKIGGLPAAVEYRKPAGDKDAEVRIQAVLDDAARTRLGIGMNDMMSGPVPFKLTGRVGSEDRESRYQIEADLRDSKISELLPGWWKDAGKAAKVTFTAIDKPQVMRFDDIVIGAGHARQGHDRARRQWRDRAGELPDLRALRRRQGDAARRPRRTTAR